MVEAAGINFDGEIVTLDEQSEPASKKYNTKCSPNPLFKRVLL